MVKSYGPVLREELNYVGNDAFFVARGQFVQVVLVQAHERPETLEHYGFGTDVGHRINETDRIERKFDEVALRSLQVVADEVLAVLLLLLAFLQDQRVGRLDVVVDQVSQKTCSLALGQVERR